MKSNLKIFDDFLDKEIFDSIQEFLLSSQMPWFFVPGVAREGEQDEFYFIHTFLDNEGESQFSAIISPLLDKLEIFEAYRIKANLYTRTPTIKEHDTHTDFPFEHKAAIFYINDNNGWTEIEGERVESKANRLVLFDGSKSHNSTSCTDAKVRVNISMNWKKNEPESV